MAIRLAVETTATDPFRTTLGTGASAAYGGAVPTKTPVQFLGAIIQALFGLLGLIFFLLMIYAGFLWMTAQGDPKKVDKAKAILGQAAAGLVIMLMAYAISIFVMGELVTKVL